MSKITYHSNNYTKADKMNSLYANRVMKELFFNSLCNEPIKKLNKFSKQIINLTHMIQNCSSLPILVSLTHMIPKLSFPSNIAVSRFLTKMSFDGYSGKSNVLKLNLKKQLPSMSYRQVFHLEYLLYRDLKVRVKNGKFRTTRQKLNKLVQLFLVVRL